MNVLTFTDSLQACSTTSRFENTESSLASQSPYERSESASAQSQSQNTESLLACQSSLASQSPSENCTSVPDDFSQLYPKACRDMLQFKKWQKNVGIG